MMLYLVLLSLSSLYHLEEFLPLNKGLFTEFFNEFPRFHLLLQLLLFQFVKHHLRYLVNMKNNTKWKEKENKNSMKMIERWCGEVEVENNINRDIKSIKIVPEKLIALLWFE